MEIVQKLGSTHVVAPPSSFRLFCNPYSPVFSLRLILYLFALRPPPWTGSAMYKVGLKLLKTAYFSTLWMP